MAIIRISDLHLKAIIGIMGWERKWKQDLLLNITIVYDSQKAQRSDRIEDALDYKAVTKRIIEEVERSQFHLLEKLTDFVLQIVMSNDLVREATVKIDKPKALRFSKSVSVELSSKR
jgi:D-erythro-7,8-dihydroneopterin triphosphate epimerase